MRNLLQWLYKSGATLNLVEKPGRRSDTNRCFVKDNLRQYDQDVNFDTTLVPPLALPHRYLLTLLESEIWQINHWNVSRAYPGRVFKNTLPALVIVSIGKNRLANVWLIPHTSSYQPLWLPTQPSPPNFFSAQQPGALSSDLKFWSLRQVNSLLFKIWNIKNIDEKGRRFTS